jgi:hypothetical protein
MMEVILAVGHFVGLILVSICLVIVIIKVIWNLGLPYAMMRDKSHGWAIFPLIEIIPLLLAILVSFLTQQRGKLSPAHLALWGFVFIFASYIHLALVAILYGIIKSLNEKGKKGGREDAAGLR